MEFKGIFYIYNPFDGSKEKNKFRVYNYMVTFCCRGIKVERVESKYLFYRTAVEPDKYPLIDIGDLLGMIVYNEPNMSIYRKIFLLVTKKRI